MLDDAHHHTKTLKIYHPMRYAAYHTIHPAILNLDVCYVLESGCLLDLVLNPKTWDFVRLRRTTMCQVTWFTNGLLAKNNCHFLEF